MSMDFVTVELPERKSNSYNASNPERGRAKLAREFMRQNPGEWILYAEQSAGGGAWRKVFPKPDFEVAYRNTQKIDGRHVADIYVKFVGHADA